MSAPTTTPPRRRWLQFNLRTGFVALTVAGLLLAAGMQWWKYVMRESLLAERLTARGARVGLWTHEPKGFWRYFSPAEVPHLDGVTLKGRTFTDADVAALARLELLRNVNLEDTSVSIVGAENLAQHCKVRPEFLLGSAIEPILAGGNDACFRRNVDVRLQWYLALARVTHDVDAEKKAYRSCREDLAILAENHSLTHQSLERQLYDAQIALADLQIAIREQHADGLLQAQQTCRECAENLSQSLWPLEQSQKLTGADEFVTGLQFVRELRSQGAQLRGDRAAELQASTDTIAILQAALRDYLDPQSRIYQNYQEQNWMSSLVIVLEAEQFQRARVAQAATTREADERTLRRISMARAEIIGHWDAETRVQLREHRMWLLGLADQVIRKVAGRHADLPRYDEQLAMKFPDLLLQSYLLGQRKMGYHRYFASYLLYRHQQLGEPVFSLPQHELERLLSTPTNPRWFNEVQAPTEEDWLREYQSEWITPKGSSSRSRSPIDCPSLRDGLKTVIKPRPVVSRNVEEDSRVVKADWERQSQL